MTSKELLKMLAHRTAAGLGVRISRIHPLAETLRRDFFDLDPWIVAIVERTNGFHMTSPERINAACKAVEYLVANRIEGDFVECGVWRGGSSMALALALLHLQRPDRHLHLFDTFEGMPPPTDADRDPFGASAARLMAEAEAAKREQIEARAGLDEVTANMRSTNYPQSLLHYIKGKVEDTLPERAPDRIALLRLDTDWYQSTIHELRTLWGRLVIGGVLIVDDYGYWQGSRRAVDEFFAGLDVKPLLNRIDHTGRMAVKTG